jgi:hypothetical protein
MKKSQTHIWVTGGSEDLISFLISVVSKLLLLSNGVTLLPLLVK